MNVRLPDGTVIENVPDDMSKADFIVKAKANGHDVSSWETAKAAPAAEKPGALESLAGGAVRGMRDLVDSGAYLLQKGVNAIAPGAAAAVNQAGGALGMDTRPVQDINREAEGQYQAKFGGNALATGGRIAGNVATAAVPGLGAVSSLPRAALSGAAQGVLLNTKTDADSAGQNALYGAAGGAVGQGIAAGVSRLGRPSANALDPSIRGLAEKAQEQGINLTGDQIAGGKPLNAIRSVLENVPFSGAGKIHEVQQRQFNSALNRTIGETGENVTEAMNAARERLGGEFERIAKTNNVKSDAALIDDLAKVETEYGKNLNVDQKEVVKQYLDQILVKGDTISGETYQKARSRIGAKADATTDPELKGALHGIQEALDNAFERSVAPKDAEALKAARSQYRNLKLLERVAPKDGSGDVSVASLANALKSADKSRFLYGDSDIGDLGRIGQQFLKGRTPDSGTAQRLSITALLAGTGHLGIIPAAMGANALMSSGAVRNYALNGSPLLQAAGKAPLNALTAPAALELLRQRSQ